MDRFEDVLIKCGAISSLIGVAILLTLIIVLLAYPVSKYCENNADNCEFISESPEPLRVIVQPSALIISLAGIAAGILLLRLGMWRRTRKMT
ncbi:MAG: hypothetical protein WBX01_15545 [Nitrososphaeraceae archaeon]